MDKRQLLNWISLVFVVLGFWGFINAPILGIFVVNTQHNLFHLITGILGLAAARNIVWTVWFARVATVIYGGIAILGILNGGDGVFLGILPINMADNILHLILGIIFAYIGFFPSAKE